MAKPEKVALLLPLEKMVPAYTPGGPGRVFDPGTFPVGSTQPGGTQPGKVLVGSAGASQAKDFGEDGRVNGPLNRAQPDDTSGRVFDPSRQESEDDAHDPGQPPGVVWQEGTADTHPVDAKMKAFGTVFNKAENDAWDDAGKDAASGMHYHHDPSTGEHHFTATARDGTPMASVYKKTGTGDNYQTVRTMGGLDNNGLLGHPVGSNTSGADIRNRAKKLHKDSIGDDEEDDDGLRKATLPSPGWDGKGGDKDHAAKDPAELYSKLPMKKGDSKGLAFYGHKGGESAAA